ncbi:hypothetical protein llap_16537 [Limosa lapponica baueri]|uniref:Uncharacterized protein n=1 Tax=Limosa lapponica baueri TaxID=1758121 RepID=A0A2I0TH93_LIMLA|nr:hypothetical protein llap_16537 [Limosa lapponica baueri]
MHVSIQLQIPGLWFVHKSQTWSLPKALSIVSAGSLDERKLCSQSGPVNYFMGRSSFKVLSQTLRGILSKFKSTRSQECPFKLDFTAYKYFPSSAPEDTGLTPQLMSLGRAGEKAPLFITNSLSAHEV